jgi:hypothetical protein
MRSANVLSIPLVDDAGRFVRLAHLYELGEAKSLPESGFRCRCYHGCGEGLRLRSVVQNILNLWSIKTAFLFWRGKCAALRRRDSALLSLRQLSSHVIEDYFGYGVGFDIEIRYLHEKEKMGTGGSLSLIGD